MGSPAQPGYTFCLPILTKTSKYAIIIVMNAHGNGSDNPRQLNIISYNLKYNKALAEVTRLANTYEPDILCLQECFAKELEKKASYLRLATKTSTGKLGLAIYYRSKRFKVKEKVAKPITQSVIERARKAERPRLLITWLHDKLSDQDIVIGNFHATEVSASNHLRRRQIKEAMDSLIEVSGTAPKILIGDFNYPFFRKGLHKLLSEYNYVVGSSAALTFKSFYYKGELDFAAGVDLEDIKVASLPFGLSDHAPIMAKVNF
jgi:endonuclease/exonuclease/phosphatase family metal-dependent hydrolase